MFEVCAEQGKVYDCNMVSVCPHLWLIVLVNDIFNHVIIFIVINQ